MVTKWGLCKYHSVMNSKSSHNSKRSTDCPDDSRKSRSRLRYHKTCKHGENGSQSWNVNVRKPLILTHPTVRLKAAPDFITTQHVTRDVGPSPSSIDDPLNNV